MDNVALN
jgi:hypothetical protein